MSYSTSYHLPPGHAASRGGGDQVLKKLGRSLSVLETKSFTKLRDVQRLIQDVKLDIAMTLAGPFSANDSGCACAPELLPLMVSLKIPANLMRYLEVAHRAGYRATPSTSSEAETAASAIRAGGGWEAGVELMRGILTTCIKYHSTAHVNDCVAMVAQLQPADTAEEPGKLDMAKPRISMPITYPAGIAPVIHSAWHRLLGQQPNTYTL